MADIVEVGNVLRHPAVQVIECMVAHSVAAVDDLTQNLGRRLDVLPHAEKGRFRIVPGQRFQYPGRYFWRRAVGAA